jgi:hypothetical protein
MVSAGRMLPRCPRLNSRPARVLGKSGRKSSGGSAAALKLLFPWHRFLISTAGSHYRARGCQEGIV